MYNLACFWNMWYYLTDKWKIPFSINKMSKLCLYMLPLLPILGLWHAEMWSQNSLCLHIFVWTPWTIRNIQLSQANFRIQNSHQGLSINIFSILFIFFCQTPSCGRILNQGICYLKRIVEGRPVFMEFYLLLDIYTLLLYQKSSMG